MLSFATGTLWNMTSLLKKYKSLTSTAYKCLWNCWIKLIERIIQQHALYPMDFLTLTWVVPKLKLLSGTKLDNNKLNRMLKLNGIIKVNRMQNEKTISAASRVYLFDIWNNAFRWNHPIFLKVFRMGAQATTSGKKSHLPTTPFPSHFENFRAAIIFLKFPRPPSPIPFMNKDNLIKNCTKVCPQHQLQ